MRYALLFALTCFVLGMMSNVALAFFAKSYYAQLEGAGAFLTPSLAKIYQTGWWRMCLILGGFTLLYSCAAFYAGLVITRNIVGPVFAFRRHVRKLFESTDADSLKLRQQDDLRILTEIYEDIAQEWAKVGKKK